MASSRSNIFYPKKVAEVVPPTTLEGGTSVEHTLYFLNIALLHAEEIGDSRLITTVKLAIRHAMMNHKEHGKYFTKSGQMRRSAGDKHGI